MHNATETNINEERSLEGIENITEENGKAGEENDTERSKRKEIESKKAKEACVYKKNKTKRITFYVDGELITIKYLFKNGDEMKFKTTKGQIAVMQEDVITPYTYSFFNICLTDKAFREYWSKMTHEKIKLI